MVLLCTRYVIENIFASAIGSYGGNPPGVISRGVLVACSLLWARGVHRPQQAKLVVKEQVVKVHAVSLLIEQPGARSTAHLSRGKVGGHSAESVTESVEESTAVEVQRAQFFTHCCEHVTVSE